MKNKIFLITLCILCALCVEVFPQTDLAIRIIDAAGAPVTGLTDANIKFRISPYGAGNVLTIDVYETGTQGNYLCATFTTFQLVELWINSVRQNWFGRQLSGDPNNTFVDQTTNETIAGDKTFTGTVTITAGVLNGNLYANSNRITSLADPVNAQDAATRAWVIANFSQDTGCVKTTGNQTIHGNKTFTGTLTANALVLGDNMNANSKRIVGLADPVNTQDAMTKAFASLNYINKEGTLPFTGNQSMGNFKLTNVANPTASQDAANKQWVLSQINNIVGPGQGYNIINLIPDGVNIGDFDAANWPDAIDKALAITALDPDLEMIIDIKGAGITDVYIDITAPTGNDAFEDRINIRSNQYINLRVAHASSYTVTLGKVLIENATIYCVRDATFNGFIFKDCVFKLVHSTGAVTFTSCRFRGNNIFLNTASLTLTECRGIPVWVKDAAKLSVTGSTYLINYEINPQLED